MDGIRNFVDDIVALTTRIFRQIAWFVLWILLVVALLAISAAVLPVFAKASDAAPAAAPVVNGWLLSAALEIFGPVIIALATTLGGLVLQRAYQFLGLKIDDKRRAAIDDGFEKGIGLAIERLGDRARGGIPVAAKEKAIEMVADYVGGAYPGAVKHFGLQKATEEVLNNEVRIKRPGLWDMAETRLSSLILAPGQEQRVGAIEKAHETF